MDLPRPLLLLGLVLSSLAPAWAQDRPAPSRDLLVVVVSIDGLRPDAVERTETPAIRGLYRNGARARVARTILPSATLPSHTSMLTGLVPMRHRVLWNSWDEEKGFIERTTCLEVAGRAGYGTAMFVGKEKLRHLARGVGVFSNPAHDALRVAAAAVEHFRRETGPALSFVHFSDPDTAGHEHGWLSEEQLGAVRDADRALAALLGGLEEAGLLERTVLILTADHGGHGKMHGTFLDADMLIPWVICGPGVKKGVVLEREVRTYDTAATALHALGLETPADWDGKAVMEAFD